MAWNRILDDVAPVLPLLGYQYVSRFHPVSFSSRSANLYFFSGIATGGAALAISLNSQSPYASVANLVYWGIFTLGLTAFANQEDVQNTSLEDNNGYTLHRGAVQTKGQPVVNVRYVNQA